MQRTVTHQDQQVRQLTSLQVGATNTTHALDYSQRFSAICNGLYGGSQSAMALDLQTTQPTISRIVNGVQTPNCDLLSAVAAKGNLNPLWLLTGLGEMVTGAGASLLTTAGCLPISGELLPGPVSDWRGLLTGLQFSVPQEFSRETCYLFEVPNDLAGRAKLGLHAGDLVLVETAPLWQRHPSIVTGQLLVVQQDHASAVLLKPAKAIPTKFLVGPAPDRGLSSNRSRQIDIDDAPAVESTRKSVRAGGLRRWRVLGMSRLVVRRQPGAAM